MLIYILIAIVQGLTEFLPVSSSGHQALIFHFSDSVDFNRSFVVALHLATLLSVLFWYRRLLLGFALGVVQGRYLSLALRLVLASLPAFAVGMAVSRLGVEFGPIVVAAALIVVGLVFVWYDRSYQTPQLSNKTTLFDVDSISTAKILAVGAAQSLAVISGVSRSGATILAGSAVGIDRLRAVDLSFLLSIPVIAGAGMYQLLFAEGQGVGLSPIVLVVTFVVAFLTGIIAIKACRDWVVRYGLKYFGYYRIALGIIVLLLVT